MCQTCYYVTLYTKESDVKPLFLSMR